MSSSSSASDSTLLTAAAVGAVTLALLLYKLITRATPAAVAAPQPAPPAAVAPLPKKPAPSACSMPTVKLGSREFDVDSEEIKSSWCEVSAADCIAFAARMTTGEISRVKTLLLVSFFFCGYVLALHSRLLFRRRA